jgi:hypothetical protein
MLDINIHLSASRAEDEQQQSTLWYGRLPLWWRYEASCTICPLHLLQARYRILHAGTQLATRDHAVKVVCTRCAIPTVADAARRTEQSRRSNRGLSPVVFVQVTFQATGQVALSS